MPQSPKKVNRPWVPQRAPFERERTTNDFDYNGRKWRKVRKSKLDVNPLCELCDKQDKVTVATVVDHIVQVKKGGAGYDMPNLQSLCKPCHDSKSGRERHF